MMTNAQEFYNAIKQQLNRLTSPAIPLHIRVENQDGTLDSIVNVKDVCLYDLSDCGAKGAGYGLQIILRKEDCE